VGVNYLIHQVTRQISLHEKKKKNEYLKIGFDDLSMTKIKFSDNFVSLENIATKNDFEVLLMQEITQRLQIVDIYLHRQ
jgi:hypothetical protein